MLTHGTSIGCCGAGREAVDVLLQSLGWDTAQATDVDGAYGALAEQLVQPGAGDL
jgi:hypothetical protein